VSSDNWYNNAQYATQNGGYQPPKTDASSSKDGWIDWARLGLSWYQSQRDPKFKNVPLSPEQKQLHQIYLQTLMNPATKDNAAKVNEVAWGQVNRLGSAGGWTSPKTFSGQTGYSGAGAAPFLPQQSGPVAPPQPTRAGGQLADRSDANGTVGLRPGVKDRDMMGGLDGIPGARMPETSVERNVGIPGYIGSTAPRGLGGDYRPMYGTGDDNYSQMQDGHLPPALINAVSSAWDSLAPNLKTMGRAEAVKWVGSKFGIVGRAAAMVVNWLFDRAGNNNQQQGGKP
jgi:hypothetical protein